MRVSGQPESLNSKYPNIWITLEKIQLALGWSDDELRNRLELTESRFIYLKARRIAPSLAVISDLISSLGLSVEMIATGKIDFDVLRARQKGDLFQIPEKYRFAAFSKRRTSIHLLDFIENRFGWEVKKYILNHFQMTEAMFYDPDDMINYLFPSDLCQYLAKSGYDSSIFLEMGSNSVNINRHTALGKWIGSFEGPRRMHEHVFSQIVGQSFDRNCDYKILKLNDENCLIESKFTEELLDSLKLKKPGNEYACASKGGSFASLSGYLFLPFSRVTEKTCIHRGDASCTYEINYEKASKIFEVQELNSKPIYN